VTFERTAPRSKAAIFLGKLPGAKVSPVGTSSVDGLILLKEAKEHAPETNMNIHLIGHSSSNVEVLRDKTQRNTVASYATIICLDCVE
jgi:hypothetical protein